MKNRRVNFSCCRVLLCPILVYAVLLSHPALARPQLKNTKEELLAVPGEIGRPGGRLVVALRGEPKTLNPLIAVDTRSREVIGVMQADLVHINRATQLTEPALAKSWKVSPNGLEYTLVLRRESNSQTVSRWMRMMSSSLSACISTKASTPHSGIF